MRRQTGQNLSGMMEYTLLGALYRAGIGAGESSIMSKLIGLDVGTKTIGIALTDALRMLAHPVSTLKRKGVRTDCEALEALMHEHQVTGVVVGLPLELDGTEERPARLARQVGDELGRRTGLPVHYVDERFTSVQAERQLIQAGKSRKKRKQVIDQAAAVIILQAHLDGA